MIWFSVGDGVRACWLDGNMVLSISSSIYNNTLDGSWYTILGRERTESAIDRIFCDLETDRLEMVPDYFVRRISDATRYEIVEDRDNRDYILSVRGLVEHEGRGYTRYRYQLNSFRSKYGHRSVVKRIDLCSAIEANRIIEAMKHWPAVVSFDLNGNDHTRVDELAISRLIALQSTFPAKHHALGLYIDGRLEGFSIYHIPPSRRCIALGNHIKHNAQISRAFDYLVYETAKELQSKGVTLLNGEQDMGIPGIRRHKQALNPIGYYRKYTIRPRRTS